MGEQTLLIRQDGSKLPVADSAAPLKDLNGAVIGCVVVFRDATKQREIDHMKNEFVATASHQLRTPLTALRWILEFPAVTCAIPGAKRPAQVAENIATSSLPPLSKAALKKIDSLYAGQIKPLVHHYW